MDNYLQQPNYGQQPARRPSPYDRQAQQAAQNPYTNTPQQRPLPPDPPPRTQQQQLAADPYSSAFALLQDRRPSGSFYPEAQMAEPPPAPTRSPELVSPRPQRLTPSMPANLAQSLDSKSKSTSPRPAESQGNMGEFQGLPPINTVTRQNSDGSSQYSLGSGLEAYLKDETFNDGPILPPASNPYNTYDPSASRAGGAGRKMSNEGSSTDRGLQSQAPKKDPYSTYNPSSVSQQQYPPQPPFAEQGRPGSRPGSSQGKQQQYPQPPAMVDYSRGNYPTASSTGRQSYHQPSSSADQSRMPPPDQYNYTRPAPPESGRSSRPLSQDMANLSLQQGPNQTTPRPQRLSGTYQQPLVADFIDMPDATVAHLTDPLPPPTRPMEAQGRQSPGRQSPRIPPSGAVASPPAMVPPSDYEWEDEIDSQRQNALQSNDPNVALTWAEKVYMYVSISTEEMRRDQALAPADALKSSTPSYERGLREDCTRIVEKFVKLGSPKAIYMRGIWYDYGDFKYPSDRHEAYHAYTTAAKQGYARAEYRLGKMYEDVGDMKRALHHYERGVTEQDSACLYRMGMIKLLGQKGHAVNIPEAIKYLHQSAGKADLDAPQGAYVLALLLAGEFSGVTVPEIYLPHDERAARRMLEKASQLGFSHAQSKLGSAYENGLWGCGYDPSLSLHYYTLAAKQGDLDAMMGLSKWYLCGAEGFAPNEEMAYIYAERAARAGLPQAEFAMGYFYEVGIYVPSDLATAESWYGRAAEHGNKDAIQRREGLSRKQTLSRKDHENITDNIRSNRLKKGQKAPPPVSTVQDQYPSQQPDQNRFSQPPPPQQQAPQQRYSGAYTSQQPQQPYHRKYSGSGQQQPQIDPHSRHSSYSSYNPPDPPRQDQRHSSYGSYNTPEYTQDNRKSSYGSSQSQPSLAELANQPGDDSYSYSPPTRPNAVSRPVSQGSLGGYTAPMGQPPAGRPQTATADQVYGMGPKTFQQMGVQTNHKKDSDCLIM